MIESKRSRRVFLAVTLIPAIALFLIVMAYPLISGIGYSFFEWSGASSNRTFIGFDNYTRMANDPVVVKALSNDLFLVVAKIVGIMLCAMFFAVAITQFNFKESSFYRTVFFFPQVMSVVTIGIMWVFIFNNDVGLINNFLRLIGLDTWAKPWLGDQEWALISIAVPVIWAGVGFFMLLLMSAITNVPTSLLEAAQIDGASRWRQFWSITVPLIWPQIRDAIVYIAITSLNGAFILVRVMTDGGPNNATQLLGSYLYQHAFTRYNFGYAAAIGALILMVSVTVIYVLRWILRKDPMQDAKK